MFNRLGRIAVIGSLLVLSLFGLGDSTHTKNDAIAKFVIQGPDHLFCIGGAVGDLNAKNAAGNQRFHHFDG